MITKVEALVDINMAKTLPSLSSLFYWNRSSKLGGVSSVACYIKSPNFIYLMCFCLSSHHIILLSESHDSFCLLSKVVMNHMVA